MLYNAVANNGKMMKPYLVQSIRENGLVVKENDPVVLEKEICSDKTLEQLKIALEGVVTNGTGKALNNPVYKIAGKTGTALVANGKRGYADHIYQSSFAGYFPADNPKYSCIVVIKNKPFAKKIYGAAVAGPVFKEIADKLNAVNAGETSGVTVKNIKKDSTGFYYAGETNDVRKVLETMEMPYRDSSGKSSWSSMYASNYKPVINQKAVSRSSVPNVKGLGLKDALYVLENMNLKVMAKGRGRVVSQSVTPGSAFARNQTILIELN
jgi:cell division protein FtsI (penicillin-binding protein 3)